MDSLSQFLEHFVGTMNNIANAYIDTFLLSTMALGHAKNSMQTNLPSYSNIFITNKSKFDVVKDEKNSQIHSNRVFSQIMYDDNIENNVSQDGLIEESKACVYNLGC